VNLIFFVDETNALDPAALARLRKLGGDKFVGEMIDLFLSYGGKQVAEARAAWQAGNLAGVAAAAHALKSSAGNVGAEQVRKLAAQTEQSATHALTEAAAADVTALEQAFAEVRPRLEAAKAGLKTGTLQDSGGGVG
jgi:HPt (histidine-containing phosphotransfer) domain-containing protein